MIGGIIKQDKIINQVVIEDKHREINRESEKVGERLHEIIKSYDIVEDEEITKPLISDSNSLQSTIIEPDNKITVSENEEKHGIGYGEEVKDEKIEVNSIEESRKVIGKSPLDLFEI